MANITLNVQRILELNVFELQRMFQYICVRVCSTYLN